MSFIKQTSLIAVITLILLELALQFIYRITSGDFLFNRAGLAIYDVDEIRGHRVKGNLAYRHRTAEFDVVYRTDANGFRTDATQRSLPVRKNEGAYRILTLGPSFAFGWANAWGDSYATLIAKGLEEHHDRVELLNAGTPSQSVNAQMCWYAKVGYRYRPDVIILTLYANSLWKLPAECIALAKRRRVVDGHLVSEQQGWLSSTKGYLKNFAVVFYGWFVIQRLSAVMLRDEVRPTSTGAPDVTVIASTVARLVRLRDYLAKLGGGDTEVVFLFIPRSFVVRTEDRGRFWHKRTRPPAAIAAEAAAIASRAREKGVVLVNPVSALQRTDAKARTYYFVDMHLTPLGNRVVANEVLSVLSAD